MEKKLYPLKFIPIPSRRPWGGDSLVSSLAKKFVETDKDGNEVVLGKDIKIGESWELADMGFEDSLVASGWLAGNTIGEIMETYMEKVVGEGVWNWYGTQFPLLIKFLDIREKLSVQVHPDDKVAEERYDSLGKKEIWYVMDAAPGAKVYMGFSRETSASEFYKVCKDGSAPEIMNVIEPHKGDAILVTPGTVHAADGGILIAEIQESSDMTFRLFDWGRENNPATARPLHLEEAIDIIDYGKYNEANFIKEDGQRGSKVLAQCPEFKVVRHRADAPVAFADDDTFHVFMCTEGSFAVRVDADGDEPAASYELSKGETILVPAQVGEFSLIPLVAGGEVVEATVERREEVDVYINPDTEAFLEGEDYGGIEDDDEKIEDLL
ncbi:MAG: class I mannose-6-phosphate isomerase [Bacteroidales bacterium]|nr:class I mannose-6-phosphate isomerase [Bacteroidales bacterium]